MKKILIVTILMTYTQSLLASECTIVYRGEHAWGTDNPADVQACERIELDSFDSHVVATSLYGNEMQDVRHSYRVSCGFWLNAHPDFQDEPACLISAPPGMIGMWRLDGVNASNLIEILQKHDTYVDGPSDRVSLEVLNVTCEKTQLRGFICQFNKYL